MALSRLSVLLAITAFLSTFLSIAPASAADKPNFLAILADEKSACEMTYGGSSDKRP